MARLSAPVLRGRAALGCLHVNQQPPAGDDVGLPPPLPRITVPARRLLTALAVAIVALTAAHFVILWIYYFHWKTNQMYILTTLFDLNEEANPASWYASTTLLLCAGLLAIIAASKSGVRDRFARHWWLLSAVFLYLSLDEAGRIHERAIVPLRTAFNLGGLLYHSWVLIAVPLVLIFAAAYLRFLFHLPKEIRLLFVLAGAIYVGGAVGVEMLEGYYDELQGGPAARDMLFSVFVAVEEGCEMLGIFIFTAALLGYIRRYVGEVRLRFGDGAPVGARDAAPVGAPSGPTNAATDDARPPHSPTPSPEPALLGVAANGPAHGDLGTAPPPGGRPRPAG